MAKKKLTRAERKAEEERVIAEMDEAMRTFHEEKAKTEAEAEASVSLQKTAEETEEKGNSSSKKQATEAQADAVYGASGVPVPQQIHCRKCGTVMENGVCPKCGYKVYVPMDGKKIGRIRLIVGVLFVAAFIVWMILKNAKG